MGDDSGRNFLMDLVRESEGELQRAGGGQSGVDWLRTYVPSPKNKNMPWSFAGREYQIRVVNDRHPEQVCMKGPQGGFTEIYSWKMFMELDWEQGKTAIYTMPREEDVVKFNWTRLKKMLRDCSRLKMLKQQGQHGERDSSRVIGVGDSLAIICPTFSERGAISQPANMLLNDEYDRSDLSNVATFRSRLGAEANPIVIRFSNPMYYNSGIHELYELSDQWVWHVCCPHCKFWQDMDWEPEETWQGDLPPFLIVPKDGREPYYGCKKCGRELKYSPDMKMEWVNKYELPRVIDGETFDIRGYWWLTNNTWAWNSAKRIWKDFCEYRKISERRAYNFGIGKPYAAGLSKIDRGDVKACQRSGLEWMESGMGKELLLGADQGQGGTNYIGLGERTIDDEGQVGINMVHAEVTSKPLFDYTDENGRAVEGRLTEIRNIYCPVAGVIDAQPNEENSYHVCRAAEGFLWRVWYKYQQKLPVIVRAPDPMDAKQDYQIDANKTMCMDKVVRMIKAQTWGFPTLDRAPRDVGTDIMKHLTKIVRKEEIKNGRVVEKWEGKPDHFANVALYLWLASMVVEYNVPHHAGMPRIVGASQRGTAERRGFGRRRR